VSNLERGAGGPDDGPEEADEAAGRESVRGEARAPVIVAALATIVIPLLVPHELVPGPRWVPAALEVPLLVAMVLSDPGRIDRRSARVRAVRIALVAFLAVVAAVGTARLIADLINGGKVTNSADTLLVGGALIWLYMVIASGFVFWELDAGGPGQRAHGMKRHPDMAFPQQLNPDLAPPGWRPCSSTTSTSASPAR
jgi:hypothetical protein